MRVPLPVHIITSDGYGFTFNAHSFRSVRESDTGVWLTLEGPPGPDTIIKIGDSSIDVYHKIIDAIDRVDSVRNGI